MRQGYEASTLYCTVLTLTRRMSSNIDCQDAAEIPISVPTISRPKQPKALSLPKHVMILLLNESKSRKVKTTETIQYRVDNANMEVVKARSHFCVRLRSPLVLFVLFHHENSLRKKDIIQVEWRNTYTIA